MASSEQKKDETKEEVKEEPKKELDESEKLVKKILFYKNPFDQLGVTPETSNDDIRRAFRKISLKVHPDRCHCEGATEASMALSKALAIVQDNEQRKPYVELMFRARQKIRDDWERAGKAWRTRIPPKDGEDTEDEQWKEDEEYLYEVRRAVHTMILQIEDRQEAQKKVAKIEEEQAAEAEKKEEERAKQERERDHKWEKQRDLRVNDWRAFQKQMKQPPAKKSRTVGGGMNKPLRPPPLVRESRPGTQQQNTQKTFR